MTGSPETGPLGLPTSSDVEAAAAAIASLVVRTPILRHPSLDAIAGGAVYLKGEHMQHIGAFKARGASYAIGKLPDPSRGVITYSSGNHGQAVALAAKRLGVPCSVAMPEDAPEVKVASVERLGAKVIFAGTTSEDRRRVALALRDETGGVIVQPFDDPDIIAGQGTATLELCDELARDGISLDALLVPVGGGGLIAGACLVAAERGVKIYSVEPEGCDAMARSIEAGERVAVEPGPTLGDGLKPVMVGELNFAIARAHLSGCFRVTDDDIGRAFATLLLQAKILVEPSGAAALAVALRGFRQVWPSETPKRVGVILSGGNIGGSLVADLLRRYPPIDPPGPVSP